MKWCIDYLIIGFIVENILLLIICLNNKISGNWWFLFIVPLGIWGLELLKINSMENNKK